MVNAIGVEAFDDFGTGGCEDYDGRSAGDVVEIGQVGADLSIGKVALFEGKLAGLEEHLDHFAREAVGLGEEEDASGRNGLACKQLA